MTDDAATLLCTGDIHLGRHPTRIPQDLDGARFSPKAVWQATVDEAIDRDVDAVVVTGDVVDRENRYFEAYGAFESGATRLDETGIPLVAVAGNHDYDVLPRLAGDLDLDHLHLLGEDGAWERWTLEHDGEALVHFDGWSFPSEHVLTSPMPDYALERDPETPVVGVLHADLDTPESDYAPVAKSDLVASGADAWLLGHIHKPGVAHEADPFVVYPGSPQPLDPGERGAHGPFVLEVSPEGRVGSEQVALATVRYEKMEVDATGAEDPKAVPPLVSEALDEHVRSEVETGSLELFLPRVELSGRCEAHAALEAQRGALEDQLEFKAQRLPVRVERLEVATRPVVDLEELAGGDTPAAWLAELLLDLDAGDADADSEAGADVDEEHEPVVEDALAAMRTANGSNAYNLLRREGWTEPPDRSDAVDAVRRQARLLLDTLLEQKDREGAR